MSRRPIVTDIDREWALRQCPAWAIRGPSAGPAPQEPDGEVDPDRPPRYRQSDVLVWDRFVADQAERFERFFGGELKSSEEWSALWRKGWWPKADARKSYPHLVPSSGVVYPKFHKGSQHYELAMRYLTPTQRAVADKIGAVMFKPNDPIVAKVLGASKAKSVSLSDRSRAMTGDAE
jgi:hypothetical protein